MPAALRVTSALLPRTSTQSWVAALGLLQGISPLLKFQSSADRPDQPRSAEDSSSRVEPYFSDPFSGGSVGALGCFGSALFSYVFGIVPGPSFAAVRRQGSVFPGPSKLGWPCPMRHQIRAESGKCSLLHGVSFCGRRNDPAREVGLASVGFNWRLSLRRRADNPELLRPSRAATTVDAPKLRLARGWPRGATGEFQEPRYVRNVYFVCRAT